MQRPYGCLNWLRGRPRQGLRPWLALLLRLCSVLNFHAAAILLSPLLAEFASHGERVSSLPSRIHRAVTEDTGNGNGCSRFSGLLVREGRASAADPGFTQPANQPTRELVNHGTSVLRVPRGSVANNSR